MRCVAFGGAALVAIASAGGSAAHAGPDPAAKAKAAAAALRKQEDAGRAKAAEEIGRVALFSALKNDFDGARRDYARAVAFNGSNEKLKSELAKIKGRRGKPLPDDLVQIAERRKTALSRCADLLTPAATAYAQADRSDELATLVQLLCVQGVPTADLTSKLHMSLYEPYLDWRTKDAVAKLDAGWEYVDGEWQDPKKVAELDATHASWEHPWVFADEVHEVKSNLPRRTAKQVAAHVFAYRSFFLGYFTGEWELTPPKVKLPVIVTRTRKEMEARLAEIPDAPAAHSNAAAFYLNSPDAVGNPCFASLESNSSDGSSMLLGYEVLQHTFEHEIGHQIAFEYSKAAASRTGDSSGDFLWVVEGLAEYMPSHRLVDGEWRLEFRSRYGTGDQQVEAPYGWCKANADRLPPLAQFIALPRERFGTAINYHIAAALTGFLFEGKDREYRQRYVDLVEAVHSEKAGPASLAACFPGDSLTTIDAEFRDWCRKLDVDGPSEK
jgi:hypothetical protein